MSPGPAPNLERRAAIVAAYEAGETMVAIGARLGVSKQRINQILRDLGVMKVRGSDRLPPRLLRKIAQAGFTLIDYGPVRRGHHKWFRLRCQAGHTLNRISGTVDHRCGRCFWEGVRAEIDTRMLGKSFGRWTVLTRADRRDHWVCRCACGAVFDVKTCNLTHGLSLGCRRCWRARRAGRRFVSGLTDVRIIYAKARLKPKKAPQRRLRFVSTVKCCGVVTQIWGARPVDGWDRKQGGLRKAR